jgi:hypothetical protein
MLEMIKKACKSSNITGVLCKPKFSDKEIIEGTSVFKIETASKYTHHQSKESYKIFGKVDTPAYNLSGLSEQLNKWIDDVLLYNNIWKFNNEDDLFNYKKGID